MRASNPRSLSAGSFVSFGAVPINPLDLLEAVRVDDEGAEADVAADEVVARVADDQTHVVAAGKVDAGLDVQPRRGLDHVHAVVAQRATLGGLAVGRHVSLVK